MLYQLSYFRLHNGVKSGGNRIRTYSVRDNRFTVCPGSPTPAYPLKNTQSYVIGNGEPVEGFEPPAS